MRIGVRPAGEDDLADWIAVRNAVTPDWPGSADDIAWSDRTYPGGVRLLAMTGGRAVGAANAGRIHAHPPDYPSWWLEITVLPEARRRGAGSALLTGLAEAARAAGKHSLTGPTWDDRPEGQAFLAHRGFTEHERSKSVRRDMTGVEESPAVPDGIRLVTLAERPDLVAGVHAVAVEAFPDIPGGDDPMYVGDLAEFRARDVDRPGIPADGFFLALDGDEVVGYASVIVQRARPTVGIHDMTAVRPGWRGRGIAKALKQATIAWAHDAGLEALETGNDEGNAPMRAVNARLGYRPLPDVVFMRGPVETLLPVG